MKDKLSSIVRNIEADALKNVIQLISRVNDVWPYFDQDVKQKIEAFVENLPTENFDDIDIILSLNFLVGSAEKRISKATRKEISETLFFDLPTQVGNRVVELYEQSRSFDQANSFAPTVALHARDYTREQIKSIIEASGNNDQITNSFEVGTVIKALRANQLVTDDEIDRWLDDADISKYKKTKHEVSV